MLKKQLSIKETLERLRAKYPKWDEFDETPEFQTDNDGLFEELGAEEILSYTDSEDVRDFLHDLGDGIHVIETYVEDGIIYARVKTLDKIEKLLFQHEK